MVSVGPRDRLLRLSRGLRSSADLREVAVPLRDLVVGSSESGLSSSSELLIIPIPGVNGVAGSTAAFAASSGVVSSNLQDKANTPANRMSVPNAINPPCRAVNLDACLK